MLTASTGLHPSLTPENNVLGCSLCPPDTLLRLSPTTVFGAECYCSHFTGEDTEAQTRWPF